jgi:uncharacterized protein YjbJ (UPF0337 family)
LVDNRLGNINGGFKPDHEKPSARITKEKLVNGKKSNKQKNNSLGDKFMNEDILQGQWKQVRGEIQAWWGRLTDDDLDRIQGSFEKLTGILQERYGYSMQEAQREIANFMEQVNTKIEEKLDPQMKE